MPTKPAERAGVDLRGEQLRRKWGKAIERQRRGRQMTQETLGDLVGVTPQAVSSWERGESAPRSHLQPAIAKALGVEWAVLFQVEAA